MQIENNISQILLDFVHVFVIDDKQDGLIVVDTGYPDRVDNKNILLKAIKKMGKDPTDVNHILITHAHSDHLGNTGTLQDLSDADIWMSAIDAPILEDETIGYRMLFKKDGSKYTQMPSFEKATVQHKTKDGDIIPLAGGIKVIATPGHSLGHQSFLLKQHGGILFIGDAVTNVKDTMELPPYFEDVKTEVQSIHKLLHHKFDKIAFAHGNYIAENGFRLFSRRWKNVTYDDVKDDFGKPQIKNDTGLQKNEYVNP